MKGKEMFTEEELEAAWNSTMGDDWADWERVGVDARARYTIFANALIAKSKGEPIERENVREGDRVRAVLASSTNGDMVIEAVAWIDNTAHGNMRIGGYAIGILDELRLVHRPAPQLPTKAPAVIKATEVRGVKGEWWLTLDHEDKWRSTEAINGWFVHLPMYITAWKPADFVVRES